MKFEAPQLMNLKTHGDERGFFCELWREEDFSHKTKIATWKQANWSRSSQGILRGLHFQTGAYAQAKAVWVVTGEVWDVCVDIRAESPTFGKVFEFALSGNTPQILFVPIGFAHGFCVTSARADFMYRCSELYEPRSECGVLWNDPALNIQWPSTHHTLSERDQKWPTFEAQREELKKLKWAH